MTSSPPSLSTSSDAAFWSLAGNAMSGLPGRAGLNITHEAVDRHMAVREFSYRRLADATSRFANVLGDLGVQPGERVFLLLGRVPELYVAVLGALKARCVVAALFAAFGRSRSRRGCNSVTPRCW